MAMTYRTGEAKTRPGIYQREVSEVGSRDIKARDGYCAIAVKAAWGPLGEVTTNTKTDEIKKLYGSEAYDRQTSTVEAAIAMIEGGASTVYVYRMGEGGAKSSLELKENESDIIAKVNAKYVGDKVISISVLPKLGIDGKKEISVYDGETLAEKFTFDSDEANEVDSLISAVKNSEYIEVTKQKDSALPNVQIAEGKLSGGQNPVVTNESYSIAWDALDRYKYNTIALDVDDDTEMTLSKMLQIHMAKAAENGHNCIKVVGEKSDVAFSDRLISAKGFNDRTFVYLGNGYVTESGKQIEGVLANCVVAGIIASTATTESITHKKIKNAVRLTENLTNSQYESGIENGMLLLSTDADGAVWFDSGVNTLVKTEENEDEGWKKIRRVKTRFEIFDRIDRALEPKIGRVNPDSDGIADIIQTGQGVLNDMVKETKLYTGAAFYLDTENSITNDSAWFAVEAADIDSLEKIYMGYKFKYQNI